MVFQNLDDLFEELSRSINSFDSSNLKNVTDLVGRYRGADWKNYANFSQDRYARNRVRQNEFFEFLVLCWLPGQKTFWHGHPAGGCITLILSGELSEYTIVSQTGQKTCRTRVAGDCAYIHDDDRIHKIVNDSKNETVSLHIYAPPGYVASEIVIDQEVVV